MVDTSDETGRAARAAAIPGTQAVARATDLLRLVTAAGVEGRTSQQLARDAGLSRATAHRLLGALRAAGMVDRDEATGRWLPGPELYVMGTVAAARYDVTAVARDIVRSLAARTEESAFLSVRRGDETVCLLREEGAFPIRSFVLSEGVRFPLGVASAGIAILAYLPDAEAEAYLARHPELGAQWGRAHDVEQLRARRAQTRDQGYALNPGLIVEGSWGMGAAVFDRAGRAEYALSLTGVEFRFSPERVPALGRILLAHAHELSNRLGAAR
ncbi:IclR family transcriptional regulator [Microbacterium stercoris]|uniref:IclR family transcriptional regulator n=1 Tax=Microbacterium stercoris TaxID=2820289 RepID=A0A939TV18_9MICO|nr:IclR family transcriptional regulator [Microbacterium stercoris]MBO3664634.1 IclR family transcriptional regulator [Microbacterium stercoris]